MRGKLCTWKELTFVFLEIIGFIWSTCTLFLILYILVSKNTCSETIFALFGGVMGVWVWFIFEPKLSITHQGLILIGYVYLRSFKPTSFPGSLIFPKRDPGLGWSRVYVYKRNPHRGWIFDLILQHCLWRWKLRCCYILKVNRVVSEILLDRRCFSPFYLNFYEYEMLIEREVCLFSLLF